MFGLFKNDKIDALKGQLKEITQERVRLVTELESSKTERLKLRQEIEDLKLKKKIEEEDIKHMIKMKEERLNLKMEKKELEIKGKCDEKISTVKDEYRNKMEKALEKQITGVKSMYEDILKRLPNVNVRLKGDV